MPSLETYKSTPTWVLTGQMSTVHKCTVTDADVWCTVPSVLASHSNGLCVKHAHALGLLPVVNTMPGLTVEDQKPWAVKWAPAPAGWKCTVEGHGYGQPDSGNGTPAVLKPAALSDDSGCGGAGLCVEHAPWFVPPHDLKALLSGATPATPATLPFKVSELYGGISTPYEVSWTYVSDGWSCTVVDEDIHCSKDAVLRPTDLMHSAGLCIEHALVVWPPSDFLQSLGEYEYMVAVPWVEVASTYWHCTIDGCSASAAFKPADETKSGAGLCAKHALTEAPWLAPPTSKPLTLSDLVKAKHAGKSTSSITPKASILSMVKPLPKLKGDRGVLVLTDGLLYFPFAEDYNKAHGGHVYSSAPVTDIGLNPALDLRQAACEFYLLMDASLCAPSPRQVEAKRQLTALTKYLAFQMSLYIECACLGEARYAASRIHDIGSAKFLSNPKWRALYSVLTAGDKDRYFVWHMFPEYAKRFGRRNLLVFVVLVHDSLKWTGGGFGGKKWAACAKTTLSYRRGRIDAVSFVDTAFGLKHNGNIVFDKLWNVGGITEILDANLRGDLAQLCVGASPEVVALWKECNGN